MQCETARPSRLCLDGPPKLSLYECHPAKGPRPLRRGIMQSYRASQYVLNRSEPIHQPQAKLDTRAATLTITQNDICIGVPQPSRSAEIIRDIIIIAAVTFPIIILRFISRSLVSSRLWWDDWAIALAAVSGSSEQFSGGC